MKIFIKNILYFSFFVVILITFIQIIISLRIKDKSIRGHDNLEQTANVNADLVFLGSSRCLAHFDPFFFDTTYSLKSVNIAVDGHSEISMAIIRLNDYLSRNKPPKFAILSFDPFMSAGDFKNNTNLVHKNDFAGYAFFPAKKNLLFLNYFHFNFYEKYIPLYALFKYQIFADALLQNNVSTWGKLGYDMHNKKWDTIANPVSDIMKKSFFKTSQIGSITKSLDSLDKLCQINNIKLLCIQTPVYKSCYDDILFSETSKICANLNIPFIDADKEYIRNDINFFYNSNHLNKKGVDQLNNFLRTDTMLASFLKK